MAKVADILSNRGASALYHVYNTTTVYKALHVMGEYNVGSVLVLNEEGSLTGILTERDYARKIALKGRRSMDTLVSEIMTPVEKIITVTKDSSIEDCMEKMSASKIRHLPVMQNGKPITVISIGDIVTTIIQEQRFAIEAMSSYIQGVNM